MQKNAERLRAKPAQPLSKKTNQNPEECSETNDSFPNEDINSCDIMESATTTSGRLSKLL